MVEAMCSHPSVQFFLFFRYRAGEFTNYKGEAGSVAVEAGAFFIRHQLNQLGLHRIDAFLYIFELCLKVRFLVAQRLQGIRRSEHAFFVHIVILQ